MIRRLAFVVLFAATGARAFVRTTTTARGTPAFWGGSCVTVVPDKDPPAGLTQDAVTATIARAVTNWRAAAPGSYLRINVGASASVEARNDGTNVIKFRKDEWCRPAEPGQPRLCFSHLVSGVTTLFYVAGGAQEGEITDADIELNAIDFTFINAPSSMGARPGTVIADLENTVTHELGHLYGLAHTCWDPLIAPQPVDDQGKPVPDCSALDSLSAPEREKIVTATMYNFAAAGETSKRTPKADDIAGVQAIYPLERDPKSCGGGGCQSVPSSGAELVLLLLVALRRRAT